LKRLKWSTSHITTVSGAPERGAGHFQGQRLFQVAAVEQAGQRIADGLFAQATWLTSAEAFSLSTARRKRLSVPTVPLR
jgi:hypothetical protein